MSAIGSHSRAVFGARRLILKTVVTSLAVVLCAAVDDASAQSLGYAQELPTSMQPGLLPRSASYQHGAAIEQDATMPAQLRRTIVAYDTREAAGTVVVDTANTYLYYVLGQGRAVRYGVGVGREGFTWSGVQSVSRKAEWPDWIPPADMIARQPYLPRWIGGGPGNPLGARALYLGSSIYRIHGTNDPSTIGKFVSSGCIRMTNDDVIDLFERVNVGTRVVVLPKVHKRNLDAYAAMPAREIPVKHNRQPSVHNGVVSGLY